MKKNLKRIVIVGFIFTALYMLVGWLFRYNAIFGAQTEAKLALIEKYDSLVDMDSLWDRPLENTGYFISSAASNQPEQAWFTYSVREKSGEIYLERAHGESQWIVQTFDFDVTKEEPK
jgi:hypothetical protein